MGAHSMRVVSNKPNGDRRAYHMSYIRLMQSVATIVINKSAQTDGRDIIFRTYIAAAITTTIWRDLSTWARLTARM